MQLTALREGFEIASNEGGGVRFEPRRVRENNPTTVTLKVNIIGMSDSASTIVVSGRWFSPLTAGLQRTMIGKDNAMTKDSGEPVELATKGWKRELWMVVENFAGAITNAISQVR